ncbi:class I SAM-dependent methyltransferase [Thiorhodococcus minor]|uniref:Class I SAM-dependent methyltransferase n=1 Tax=Thiorhodococcus minor TaxID=57489 RepID=A0A6M0JSA6_9GAMM|nr:class I SAM-dependent methyltransferase [Thiorhodococcus minor]NEV60402.1 class I SAM-dependent methyltransferase [Thiorhodococcus minor]
MTSDNRTETRREIWDHRYAARVHPAEPALVLTEALHLLPRAGDALDAACGVGGNALKLAEIGLRTSAWDLSPVAIERVRTEAKWRGLGVDARVRDIVADPPSPRSFDVVCVAYFLDRTLAAALAAALRPDGLLLYQTFSREAVTDRGPSNPEFRLVPNELLRLFPGLIVRAYRDEGCTGDTCRGTRDIAFLIAQASR